MLLKVKRFVAALELADCTPSVLLNFPEAPLMYAASPLVAVDLKVILPPSSDASIFAS